MWSDETKNKIDSMKKLILKKKIILGFMIERYSKFDMGLNLIQWSFVLIVPVLSLISEIQVVNFSKFILIISTLTAAIIKLKNHLNFDKIVSDCKDQCIKYERLYQQIDSEILKPDVKKQSEDEYIYWLTKDLNIIELGDPDISYIDKQKFIKKCKDANIPYEDDMTNLINMYSDKKFKQEIKNYNNKADTNWAINRLNML
jgi:hypothetical protein